MKLDELEILARAASDDQSCDVEIFSQWVATASPATVLRLIGLLRKAEAAACVVAGNTNDAGAKKVCVDLLAAIDGDL